MDWRATSLIWIVRLTGLGLVIVYLDPALDVVPEVSRMLSPSRVGGDPELSSWLGWGAEWLARLLLLALGLHLLLGGRWLLRRMLRGLDGSCPACGHPWPDAGAVRCPECGFGIMVAGRRGPERADPRPAPEKVS